MLSFEINLMRELEQHVFRFQIGMYNAAFSMQKIQSFANTLDHVFDDWNGNATIIKCFNDDWDVVVDLNLISEGYARAFEAIHKKDRIVVKTHLTPRVDGSADVSLDIEYEGQSERSLFSFLNE